MSNIVQLKKPLDKEAVKLYNFGIDVDQVLLHHLELGLDAREMAVVVGHRIGEFLKTIDNKEAVIETVIEYIKRKAEV